MKLKIVVLLAATLLLAGCQPAENTARDSIAAAKGVIEQAQAEYLAACTADSAQRVCNLINDAVAGQNLAIDALNLYCSGSGYLAGGACQPNKEYLPRLQEAVRNLGRITTAIKELSK